MDSQQAAFEKFKAAGSGNKFARESRHAGGMQKEFDGPVPDLYSIHNGSVVRIEDYGAFVQIPGFKKHGLVYKSQASNHFTQSISDVVTVGDHVWVKVTSVQDGKVALSMKYVSQGDGTDLDPNLVKLTGDEDRKRSHTGFMDKAPISIEEGGVLLKTVCKKCGAAGHLAAECFSGGGQFELLPEDDQDDNMAQVSRSGRSGDKEKKKKRDKDDRRDKDRVHGRDRDRHKESRHDHRENRNDHRENRHDHKERKDASSHHRDKRHNRSRSPKRRAEEPHGSNVESLEEALAVMRAHKVRFLYWKTKQWPGGATL
ncbi:Nucleolar protein of 40 kDa [Mortierella claussenii]|nr:Nucleolar protein of 40 kDa [Mortierella claussenii]